MSLMEPNSSDLTLAFLVEGLHETMVPSLPHIFVMCTKPHNLVLEHTHEPKHKMHTHTRALETEVFPPRPHAREQNERERLTRHTHRRTRARRSTDTGRSHTMHPTLVVPAGAAPHSSRKRPRSAPACGTPAQERPPPRTRNYLCLSVRLGRHNNA